MFWRSGIRRLASGPRDVSFATTTPANRCCEVGASSVRDLELRWTNLTISASAI